MPFTLENEIYFEEDIKKSRFQAIVAPVENEQAMLGLESRAYGSI